MWKASLLAAYGFALVFDIPLIGRLTGADFVALVLLPFALSESNRKSFVGSSDSQFFGFIAIWLFGAFASDIINNSAVDDIARGWSKIVFFLINFIVIRYLVEDRVSRAIKLILFLALAAAGRAQLGYAYEGDLQMFGNGWKFGYGIAFTVAMFVAASLMFKGRRSAALAALLPLAASLVNLSMNARSLFGISLVAASVGLLLSLRKRVLKSGYVMAMVVLSLLGSYGALAAYTYAAESGLLGREAQEKHVAQAHTNLGVILGGRGESLGSTNAIADAPILGHGSWARNIKYTEVLITQLERAGVEIVGDPFRNDLIPSHSHLLGAWVEHGVLGALFWTWAAFLTLRALRRIIQNPSPLSGIALFIGISLLWDVLFSPFALERRTVTAAWLYFMMLIIEKGRVGAPLQWGRP